MRFFPSKTDGTELEASGIFRRDDSPGVGAEGKEAGAFSFAWLTLSALCVVSRGGRCGDTTRGAPSAKQAPFLDASMQSESDLDTNAASSERHAEGRQS